MRNLLLAPVLCLILSLPLNGQEPAVEPSGPWTFKGMAGLNFSQVALVNWAQGGENSQAINALMLLNLNYTKGKSAWGNTLDMGYGIQKSGENPTSKMNDYIDFISKYGYETGNKWFISGLFNFKTQFDKGYKGTGDTRTLISEFMSPGYLSFNFGMEYKPDDRFYLLLAPIGAKATIVTNDELSAAGAFGVEPGKSFRAEMGAAVRVMLIRDLMKNVTLTTSADLFSNLLNKPGNIDVSWKALINMKINEFLSANISTHLLYDDDVDFIDFDGTNLGPRIQFKEVLGIGFSVKF
ncbi:MAG: DUF3078 domain-containing protein [Bacteroidales bacterium]|nr:DUF3078 domain-containing protein [Bacteroidales bacterium]